MDADSGPEWTTNEIIYCAIGGTLLLMALAEIFAMTGSLSYSFIKVHQKAKAAGQRGVQYLSLIIMAIFYITRIFFLLSMFSLIPIPHWQGMSSQPDENHEFIPAIAITISQYFSFSLIAILLVMPAVVSLHQIFTSPKDVKERIEAVRSTSTFPRVLIVMPVYNELPDILHIAICSAIDGDYPKEHLHIFISFDNDAVSDLYRALIGNLGVPSTGDYYPPVLDLYFRGVQITVSRFPHGGKRLTQKKTFSLINSIYKEYPDKTDHLFVLFIDSDIVLPASTIANFVWDMELKPNSKNLLAMTGVITVTTKDDMSFINLLQDIEYVHGQFIGRAIESAVGGCVTLPGALTIFRYSAFLESYDEYFAERSVSDLWDFGRSHLGEDRYLTHLLMTKAKTPKLIQFCHRATCKTEPVREWRNLMKQRRRWFLGFMTNEGAFLSDPRLWRKYPWLLSFRLLQDIISGTSMVSYIIIVAIATGVQNWSFIWIGLLITYLLFNWGLMLAYGIWLGRYKALLYPLMFTVGPFVSWWLIVYGVATANERTWGGPRADAATSKDEEHGDNAEGTENNGGDENNNGDDRSEYHDFDPDQDVIELPDHLFYPNQTELVAKRSKRRPMNPSKEADSDVNSLDLSRDDLEEVITQEIIAEEEDSGAGVVESGISVAGPSGHAVMAARSEGCELKEIGGKAEVDWDEDEDEFVSDDDSDNDAQLDGLHALEQDGYFGSQSIGFTPNPLLKHDTEWWDDDIHLSNLGILPYLQQPKIPAMFASAETLILTPVIPSASINMDEHRSSRSTARSSHGSLASPRMTGSETPRSLKPRSIRSIPSTPKVKPTKSTVNSRSATPVNFAPGTPKRLESRRGSLSSSSILSPPQIPGSRRGSISSPSSSFSLPLPPGFTASPRPSFRYMPVEYLTPTHSTMTTPKMSPMIQPSTSGPNSPLGFNSIPPLPSPSISYTSPSISYTSPQGGTVHASSRVPAAIVAAALAISASTNQSAKKHSTTRALKVVQVHDNIPKAAVASTGVLYPLPPSIPQRISSKPHFPSPPLDPAPPTASNSS
ncbi:hypothetical protein BGZ76_009718 [Entomortierella beljakovae]|nr:hypothetical protein BGZ76_009718 [Entomortierella beljakovae]